MQASTGGCRHSTAGLDGPAVDGVVPPSFPLPFSPQIFRGGNRVGDGTDDGLEELNAVA